MKNRARIYFPYKRHRFSGFFLPIFDFFSMSDIKHIFPRHKKIKNRLTLKTDKRSTSIWFQIILLSSCSFPILAHADQCPQGTPPLERLNRRLNKLEKTMRRTANPSALLAPGPFAQVDLLFWQAREDGLSYAIIANQPSFLEITPKEFNIKEPQFEWDFAFRLGAGYGNKRDGFDLFAQWTRFFTDARDTGNNLSSGKFFLPIWAHPNFNGFPFDPISDTEAHWTLHFNEIDAGIGRSFYISKFFTVRPFVGPSSVSIDQKYKVKYKKPPISNIPERKDTVHLKNDFFGIGARAGCELRFHFIKGLSLMTRGSAAIYAGRFKVRRQEKFSSAVLGDQSFYIPQNIHLGRAATSLESGFCWEHGINHKAYIRAELCYDLEFFFKQNQMLRVISEVASPSGTFLADQGDLVLQGGSFSVTVGF